MSAGGFTESVVEEAALAWLEALDYAVLHGPEDRAGRTGGGAERLRPSRPGAAPARCARAAEPGSAARRRWRTPSAS